MIESEKQQICLIVDDDEVYLQVLCKALTRRGLIVHSAPSAELALEELERTVPDLAVIDLKLEGQSGLHLIKPLITKNPQCKILMLTGYASITTAVDAIKLGAINYLSKPADADQIITALHTEAGLVEHEPAASPMSINRLEWEHIQRTLKEHDNNISAAARSLGMHRRTLQRKLQKRPKKQ
ncbi:MAG: response regulator transcription factor [Pseudomonadales bacterium]|nr:response regulator transcription factor [Pseudomonadales bacterium]